MSNQRRSFSCAGQRRTLDLREIGMTPPPNNSSARPKIAVIHPDLQLGGGSEACALWIIEALKQSYDITLMTSRPVDFAALNQFYNTSLTPGEISVVVIPPPILLKNPRRFAALRTYRLSRYCRRVSSRFQVMFSTYSFMDFGKKGIQYILDPHFNEQLLKKLNPSPQKWTSWFYRDSFLRKAYLGLSKRLAGLSMESLRRNLTLVDSNWTGAITKTFFGLETITVYPPVLAEYPSVPWGEREEGFVSIGRIVPEKQIDKSIEIIRNLRRLFPSQHLHILGRTGDVAYANHLKKLSSENQSWLFFEGDVNWQRKAELLSRHKYGIHGKENEPFGIVIAEMISAGCIVWVPNGGGQVEIVKHPLLIYSSPDDGQDKIARVLKDKDLQASLRQHLAWQASLFSVSRFKYEIGEIVLRFMENQQASNAVNKGT